MTGIINHSDEDYYNLLESVLTFINTINQSTLTKSIVIESLKILEKLDCSESSAFYKMDPENFEFSLHSSFPESENEFYTNVFDFLSDSGSIGIALQTGNLFVAHNEAKSLWHLILPVMSTRTFLGVFTVTSKEDFSSIGIHYSKLLLIFARSFGISIENQELLSKQHRTNEILDQLIASRTIELVENNQALGEKIESLKSNLSMSIPHEVRTPINEIIGMTNYLKMFMVQNTNHKDDEKSDVLEIINDIQKSAGRLKNLFENFIYHTRLSIISTSIKEIEQIQSQVSPYCESIILEQAQLKAQSYDRLDDIEINLVSSVIRIGEEYLAKLVDELVDNAMKYSKKGEKVILSSSIERNLYHLTIMDEGSGIPSEFLNQIDAYIQFDRKKNEQQGLGLGLAIVYKIVDLHNGHIQIDSQVNKFTKVSIKIQIATDFHYE